MTNVPNDVSEAAEKAARAAVNLASQQISTAVAAAISAQNATAAPPPFKWTENKLAAAFVASVAVILLTTSLTALFNLYNNVFTINNRLNSLEKTDLGALSYKLLELDQRLKKQEELGVVGHSVQNEINRLWDDLNETESTLETLRETVTTVRERLAKAEATKG
ncbi:hypothetical protein ETAA8_13450 [Anatilimnocola aggregata]|uniref:Uncharacterized protein n=1 Tax=Anatilimnocola aggregata TaxID=2528021 RepID=A0A517Y7Q6_9BACT|nr:hypothetical protein [Anatilimnocola aggregata]QDU26268.1 hypothetical protein ETAA8_13450 [Anatilimnocola aggregata]